MHKTRAFKFCPCCGSDRLTHDNERYLHCPDCDFIFYRNAAATSSVIIEVDHEFLMVKRAREPAKDLFDFPGGFVDFGETAEQAASREVEEELGLQLSNPLQYVCNFPNTYRYEGIEYHTLDYFFRLRLSTKPQLTPTDDVSDIMWTTLTAFDHQLAAFESVLNTINAYTHHLKQLTYHIP